MRVRIAGQTLILRPTTWTITFLVMFMLLAIYVITDRRSGGETVVTRRSDPLDGALQFKAVAPVHQFHDEIVDVNRPVELDDGARRPPDMKPAAPMRHFQAPAGAEGHKSREEAPPLERNVIHMAMDAVKVRMTAVRRASKTYLAAQNRPSDSHYNINVTLSDAISLDRPIKDTRPASCRAKPYVRAKLPRASVVIPFYNEALSMLLRTIHSVLNRSPDDLLNEIILVDDRSTHEHLLDQLDRYIALIPKVKIIRNNAREGLIVSRMRGCALAKGPVVIFLDAHTEANEGWLEPLVDEIQRHPESVIQPFVDGIDAQTIEYSSPPSLYKGSFSWDLRYTWLRVTEQEAARAIETGYPFFSPTLVGCAIAVDKTYFQKIGQFDPDMKIWGGENIELAFRTWMCGGRVVTVVCSRVGHVFKNFPYKFDGDRESIVQKNLIRVAETWMDGVRKYFYAATRTYEFKRVELTSEENRSLQRRKDLRKNLKCHNFEWYLYNIIPEVPIPPMDAVYYGELTNLKSHACFEILDDYYVGMTYYCFEHKLIPKNNFALMRNGLMRYQDKCVKFDEHVPVLRLAECPTEHLEKFGTWSLRNHGHTWGQLEVTRITSRGEKMTMCIMQVTNVMSEHNREQMPELAACDPKNDFQLWSFSYKFSFDQVPREAMFS
ncbi:Polypeptide N-acetylgalactosaminyltransferase 6 [Lamellibrachia satsuma]|nr:Polypeptide N-acetylgalactosaminyltransferase 6 [Lamellibrachia satsuma]